MYARLLEARLKRDRHHILLLGPRQVGKSTLLGSLQPDITLNLASLATFREFVAQPEHLEPELLAAPSTSRTIALAERARKLTRRIVVFLGTRRQRVNGIEALPIDDFLAELPS